MNNNSHSTQNNNDPLVSVIIPVYNGSFLIKKCIEALNKSTYRSFEILVVDDCSTDNTSVIVKEMGIQLIQSEKQRGPGFARNQGVKKAKGDIILFIDSDIIAYPDTIKKIVDNFSINKDLSALFGSYDDKPTEKNFISQYRNLFHHYHHQDSNREATTFWAGCGAIKKTVFEKMNGFNCQKYLKPSIEDIELGYRLTKAGYKIVLDKNIQVTHVKRWDFCSMIRTDVFQRAIPWSRLIMETKFMPEDLNLSISHKVSSACVALLLLTFPALFSPYRYYCFIFLLLLLAGIIFLNKHLYTFYIKKRGFTFMLGVIPFHILYYFYSGVSYVFSWVSYRLSPN